MLNPVLLPSQRAAECARPLLSRRVSFFTNCPLAGRFAGGIWMGVVRLEQAELQDPLFTRWVILERVARLAL